jgi:RHS repeat-associated protein
VAQSGATIALISSAYTYNARGQLSTLTNSTGTISLSQFSSMTYDGVGNRLSMQVSIPIVRGATGSYAAGLSGKISWTYDNQDHLTQENNQFSSTGGGGTDQYAVPYTNNFVSDAAENLTTFRNAGVNYSSDNQLMAVTYDGEGNPNPYPLPGFNPPPAAAFDPEDRLTNLSGFFTAGYFADSRRTWRQVGSNPITYYLYDGATLLAELDANGNVVTTYGVGAAGLVQRSLPGANGGITYGYTYDPAGNAVQRTSTTGLALSVYADFTTYYDAFGAQLHQIEPGKGASLQGPDAVGFGGQWGYYTENETSPPAGPQQMPVVRYPLCLLGARYYDPSVGRFLTRDPAGYESGPNVYAYCENSPIMHADPTGLRPITRDDIAALSRLYQFPDGSISKQQRLAAIDAIKAAIAAVPDGTPDPAPLNATLWGLNQLLDARYGCYPHGGSGNQGLLPGMKGMPALGRSAWKCNYFVAYAFTVGAGVPWNGWNGYPTTSRYLRDYPATARTLGSSMILPTLSLVDSGLVGSTHQAKVGDIISWDGHTSLSLGGGDLVIYAGPEYVKIQTIQYVEANLTRGRVKPHNIRRWRTLGH